MRMRIAIILLPVFVAVHPAHAQEAGRIERLEREVQELKDRLTKLEAASGGPVEKGRGAQAPGGESWRSVASWRALSSGMSPADVRRVLGEPERIDGGTIATWYYGIDGRVYFFKE